MITIIDHICLHDPERRADFIRWVQAHDYPACLDLPSVQRFQVFEALPGAEADFFEVINATSWEAFEQDMRSPTFAVLVAGFSALARVSRQIVGTPLPPGFSRDA